MNGKLFVKLFIFYWKGVFRSDGFNLRYCCAIIDLFSSKKILNFTSSIQFNYNTQKLSMKASWWTSWNIASDQADLRNKKRVRLICEPFDFLEAAMRFERMNNGFADRCLSHLAMPPSKWSGRTDLNRRRLPWQGSTLPLSYAR